MSTIICADLGEYVLRGAAGEEAHAVLRCARGGGALRQNLPQEPRCDVRNRPAGAQGREKLRQVAESPFPAGQHALEPRSQSQRQPNSQRLGST